MDDEQQHNGHNATERSMSVSSTTMADGDTMAITLQNIKGGELQRWWTAKCSLITRAFATPVAAALPSSI
jgi:hypothetical protein